MTLLTAPILILIKTPSLVAKTPKKKIKAPSVVRTRDLSQTRLSTQGEP